MEDYSELCQALDIEDFEYITGQRDWSIVKLNDRYWYYEHPVEGASDVFYEVVPTLIPKGEQVYERKID